MAIVLTSTTSPQSEMDRVVSSDDWRTSPSTPEESAPSDGESIPIDKLPPKQFNEVRQQQIEENKDAARNSLNGQERTRPKKGGVDKKIDNLTKRWRSEESLRIAAERELAELRTRLNGAPPAQTPPASQTPASPPPATETPTAHKEPAPTTPAAQPNVSGEQYDEAVRNQLQQSAQQRELAALKPRWDNTSTPQERAELIAAFNQNYTGARVIDSVAREISNLSNPVQVSLVVAKNPQLATTLSKMSQAQVAMVLGSISRDLEARAATNQEKPERPKVRPPAPIEPINGSGSRASIPLDQLPPREFNAIRNKQERERRRR